MRKNITLRLTEKKKLLIIYIIKTEPPVIRELREIVICQKSAKNK